MAYFVFALAMNAWYMCEIKYLLGGISRGWLGSYRKRSSIRVAGAEADLRGSFPDRGHAAATPAF